MCICDYAIKHNCTRVPDIAAAGSVRVVIVGAAVIVELWVVYAYSYVPKSHKRLLNVSLSITV